MTFGEVSAAVVALILGAWAGYVWGRRDAERITLRERVELAALRARGEMRRVIAREIYTPVERHVPVRFPGGE